MRAIKHSGFSFVELLITISLMGILLALVMPAQSGFHTRVKAEVFHEQLLRAINMARIEAGIRGQAVTLCQSSDHQHCGGRWQDGQILFVGSNEEAHRLYVFESRFDGELHWRSALNREFLQVQSWNEKYADNGTFWYCPQLQKNPAWGIVVNQSGRARSVYPDRYGVIKGLTC